MKLFSILSTGMLVLGVFFFGLNWSMDSYSDFIVLLGFISLLIGIVLSFIAIAKQERGVLKFFSLFSFFIVLFLITWFEPFQVIRTIAWLKNLT
ncbi:hypothetical protein [Priestia megaterium]|uniref:hypothetical protein n=1 Tax=Priestia megaterium TaxID=1404 RepID=UPI0036DB6699